jgi:hypothetical protein
MWPGYRFLRISEPADGEGSTSLPRHYAEAVAGLLPLLQAHAADDAIGSRVEELAADATLDPRYAVGTATFLIPIRALFHRNRSVRQHAMDRLVRHPLLAPCPRFAQDILQCDGADAGAGGSGGGGGVAGWEDHTDKSAIALAQVLSNSDVDVQLRVVAAEHISQLLKAGRHHTVLLQHRLFAIALKTFELLFSAAGTDGQVLHGALSLSSSTPRPLRLSNQPACNNGQMLRGVHFCGIIAGACWMLAGCCRIGIPSMLWNRRCLLGVAGSQPLLRA